MTLFTLLSQHPQAFGAIVRGTPTWVWLLLAALVALGLSQLRDRTVSALRMALVPAGMTAFSAWGMVTAFSASYLFLHVMAVWIAVAAAVAAAFLPGNSQATYDPLNRSYRVPGSVLPLLMIAGIFLVKWVVGVELALAPHRVQEAGFALAVACVYGLFTGLFVGRSARLWKLALSTTPSALAA